MTIRQDTQFTTILNALRQHVSDLASKLAHDSRWPKRFDGQFVLSLDFWFLKRNISLFVELEEPCLSLKLNGELSYKKTSGKKTGRKKLAGKIFKEIYQRDLVQIVFQQLFSKGELSEEEVDGDAFCTTKYDLKIKGKVRGKVK